MNKTLHKEYHVISHTANLVLTVPTRREARILKRQIKPQHPDVKIIQYKEGLKEVR